MPQGFHWHETSQADRTDLFDEVPDVPVLREQMARAERQLGTLGGGNHFIELQVDPSGVVWVMIHSGSRNVGKQTAERYDRLARDENRRRLAGTVYRAATANVGRLAIGDDERRINEFR